MPGEFWPVIDGTLSYYQYAAEDDLAEMQALRHTVVAKAGYLDETDAGAWGSWFGARIAAWLGRFKAAPEMLESWAWRVLWAK